MFFYDKLRLLELLRQDDVKTYLAADPSTGRNYLLHWLPEDGSPALTRVTAVLDALPDAARELIIEAGRRDGRSYVITQNPPSFTGLEPWLEAVRSFLTTTSLDKKGAWKIPSELLKEEPPKPAPGEFTQLFMAPGADTGAPQPGEVTRMMSQVPAAPRQTPSQAPPEPPAQAMPGEFTSLFLNSNPVNQQEPASTPPTAEQPTAPANAPGEFTRLFMAPDLPKAAPESAPAPTPPPATSAQEPGEFTRMLRAQSGSSPIPQPPTAVPIPQRPTPAAPPPATPGEFTALFANPVRESSQPVRSEPAYSVPPSAEPGEFTRLIRSVRDDNPPRPPSPPTPAYRAPEFNSGLQRNAGDATGIMSAQRPVITPLAASIPQGPGEYTRLFGPDALGVGSPAAVAPVVTPTPAEQAPKPAPKKSDPALYVVVVILALLALCALGLILFFVLKR